MQFTLIRHATSVLEYAGRVFLIDPVLGGIEPDPDDPDRRLPLTPIPATGWDQVTRAEVLLQTHLHYDHFDAAAVRALPKSLPVLAQPEDVDQLRGHGFTYVTAVKPSTTIGEIAVIRTMARHGHGEAGDVFAPASGYILQAAGEPTLYLVGDSVWCEEVDEAIRQYSPDVIVVNGGAAHARGMGPITMTGADIVTVREASDGELIVVHTDAFPHLTESRADLDAYFRERGVRERIHLPADGETIVLTAAGKG
jgi:L-ascorbate metabolism protein UlaG (beta-lactamase superfamily)